MTQDIPPAAGAGPLAGLRVLDYAQYVAGPFATMLLADLGAEVIKVEPPQGDAWRRYEPLTPDGGTWFISLNRNKQSVVADLKTDEGRALSRALIASADVVVHNMPPARAIEFGLDRESVRSANPRTVWCCVSAFGSDGPEASTLGYDLVAQAASGLLLADVQPADEVPRRSGGIAMADLTAGLLTFAAALTGLLDRFRQCEEGDQIKVARGLEVSLLGASLAVQVQRFVAISSAAKDATRSAGPQLLSELAAKSRRVDELEPYYRCYAASDGFIALACLNQAQRLKVQSILRIEDPWSANPQADPADDGEREFRAALRARFAAILITRPVDAWMRAFAQAGVPAGPVRDISQVHDLEQARVNGLVQTVEQPGVGTVSLLGSLFKIDGVTSPAARPAPRLGEQTEHHKRLLSDSSLGQGAP